MMNTTILLIFLAALAFLGLRFQSDSSSDSFHIENKEVGLWKVTFGIFSVVGGGEFIAVAALACSYGMGSIMLFVGFALGALIFTPLVSRVRQFNGVHKQNRDLDVFSIPDFAYIRYGRAVSSLATFYTVIALGSLLLIQLALGGTMIGLLTGMPYTYSVLLMSVTLAYYVYRGGFNSILVTDVIQVFSLFIVFMILSAFSPFESAPILSTLNSSTMPEPALLSVLLVGGICWVLGGGDIWQRIMAAKSDTVAKNALYLNSVLLVLFGLILSYLCTRFFLNDPSIDPDNAFLLLLSDLPSTLQSLAALGLTAGLLSTSDTELHTIATIVNKEVSRESKTPIKTKTTQAFILVISIVAAALAIILKDQLVSIYYILLNVFIILGGLMLPAILGRGNRKAVMVGLLLGGITLLLLVAFNLHTVGTYSLLVGIPPLCAATLPVNTDRRDLSSFLQC